MGDEYPIEQAASSAVVQTPPQDDAPENAVLRARADLLKKHYGGHGSIVEKVAVEGVSDPDTILREIVLEIMKDMDSLKGNELMSTHSGDIKDASVLASKHAEVAEKVVKILQAQRRLEREAGIDLNSPHMRVIIKYFLSKVKETMDSIGMSPDQANLFYQNIGKKTENWKKDLKEEFKSLNDDMGMSRSNGPGGRFHGR